MNENLQRGSIYVNLLKFKYKNNVNETLLSLNIKIDSGEFIGLMGRTGAGKTTSLMLLNGLIPHFIEGDFEGDVITNTMNTKRYRIQTLARFAGLVLQDPETQIFGITLENDVAFGPANLGFDRKKISDVVKNSLKAVGLEGYEKRITSELSGGEKQRLAIAGVLAMEPEILILDEPTSELDPEGKFEIYNLLYNLNREKGVTIIISGHDSDEMLSYTDRIIVLENGMKVLDDNPKQLFKDVSLTQKLGLNPPETAIISNSLSKYCLINENLTTLKNEELISLVKNKFNGTKIKITSKNQSFTSPITPVIIETKNLTFSYQEKMNVLSGINLKIYAGEFVALIGKNGAGKTTFSKHLNGLLRPKVGQVFINSRNIYSTTTSQLSKEVGYVFQNPDHQIFSASVYDEIEFGLKKMNLSETDKSQRISEALSQVGLEGFQDRHPFTLGKGERQKLAFATVVAMKPKILIIDEPTTGQDLDGINKMMAMLKELYLSGYTIIMITHNMDIAAKYADRIIVFSNGKIVKDGPPNVVFYDFEILKSASISPPLCASFANQLRESGYKNYPVTSNEFISDLIVQFDGEGNVN